MMYRTRHGAIAVILGLLGTGASPVLARSFYPCLGVSPVETTELKSIVVAEQLGGRVIAVTSPPGDINRLFMALKNGRVFIHARGDARADNRLFLDLSAQINDLFEEMGLLGFAFDPDYADNGHFYVSYTDSDDPERGPHWLVLSRFSVS
ncbi:MAG: hypothetical protein JSV80_15255, partial [Acidobacteriota bacterium]